MSTTGLYQRFSAWAILLVFLAGWSLGTLHLLSGAHDHSGKPECSVSHDPNVSHIHDQRYAKEQCSLCAFVLSAPALLSISALLPTSGTALLLKDTFHCIPSCSGNIHDTTCLRGPPVL